MSMFRRRTLPDAGHEQHDTLLIAQYAALDPLDREQIRQAAELVGGCAECASLAADLGAISRAVAAEPMPQRLRAFTLTPERAEKLRGSPLQRFMRRLAMPESRVLRPFAAGVMSLGLVLVVAGNVIPIAEDEVAGIVPTSNAVGESDFFAVPTFVVDFESGFGAGRDLRQNGADLEAPAERAELPAAIALESALGNDEAQVNGIISGTESAGRRAKPTIEAFREADIAASADVADQLDLLGSEVAELQGDRDSRAEAEVAGSLDVLRPEASEFQQHKDPAAPAEVAGSLDVLGPDAREPLLDGLSEAANERLGSYAQSEQGGAAGFADAEASADPRNRAELRAQTEKTRLSEVGEVGDNKPDDADGVTDGRAAPDAPEDLFAKSAVGADVPGSSEQEHATATVVAPVADSLAADDVLVPVGTILAVGGFLLLVLIWFARYRNPDPLAS
jgi:hypothetical protein